MIPHFIHCTIQIFKPGIKLATTYLSYCVVSTSASSVYMQVPKLFQNLLPQHTLYTYIYNFFPSPKMPSFPFQNVSTFYPSFKTQFLPKSDPIILHSLRLSVISQLPNPIILIIIHAYRALSPKWKQQWLIKDRSAHFLWTTMPPHFFIEWGYQAGRFKSADKKSYLKEVSLLLEFFYNILKLHRPIQCHWPKVDLTT